MIYLAGYWIVAQLAPNLGLVPLHERPAMFYSIGLLLLGGQLMSMGFLGELILAYHKHDIKTYSIAERTDRTDEETTPRREDAE